MRPCASWHPFLFFAVVVVIVLGLLGQKASPLKKNRKENHKTQDISGLIFLFCVNGSHGYSWFGTGFNVIVNRKSAEYCSEYDDGVPDQFV